MKLKDVLFSLWGASIASLFFVSHSLEDKNASDVCLIFAIALSLVWVIVLIASSFGKDLD